MELDFHSPGVSREEEEAKRRSAAPLCETVSAHRRLSRKKKKKQNGKREKSQTTGSGGSSPTQGFPSVAVTSHSRRTSTFFSVQLEGQKKREREKEESAGPDNERASWRRRAVVGLARLHTN